MSKKISLLAILLVAFMMMFAVSCEGPAGPAGADGTNGTDGVDGADGNVTCLGCHESGLITDNQLEMARSQHALGDMAVSYAGGRASCAQCHSHQGFVEFATTGTVSGDYMTPTPWECSTCHGLHTDFEEDFTGEDAALRMTDAVTMIYDGATVADINPTSNLCVNCHQARTAYPTTSTTVTSTHFGPHHGPQANLLLGVNGSVAGTPMTAHVGAGCTGCHMKETEGEDLNVKGGHTFWASVEACQECHSSATDLDVFSIQTNTETKLETLAELLVEQGVLDTNHTVIPGTYTQAQFDAFWNFIYVEEDRSLGVHNPAYANTLLDAAIDGID